MNTLLLLNASTLGKGDSELGHQLMLTYLKKLSEIDFKIDNIFCVNEGVKLTTTDLKAIELIKVLELKGCIVASCGTCLDFYNLRESLQVGQVGSMDLMIQMQKEAQKVLIP
jgi:selenium metabolism protein YedF